MPKELEPVTVDPKSMRSSHLFMTLSPSGQWDCPIGTWAEVPNSGFRLHPPGPRNTESLLGPYFVLVDQIAPVDEADLAYELSRLALYEHCHVTRLHAIVRAHAPNAVLAIPCSEEDVEAAHSASSRIYSS